MYVGSAKKEQLSGINKLFYSDWGEQIMDEFSLDYDFSLLNTAPTYDQSNDLIVGDWHPNEIGHKKIANGILQSNENNGLRKFVNKTCISKRISKE